MCDFHVKSVSFSIKSFKLAVSRHSENSKMVSEVYIVLKILPGDMINFKCPLFFYSDLKINLFMKFYLPPYSLCK